MKRTLLPLMFLALFGTVLAGPPVDYQLVCGEGADAPLVGVASLVEGKLHMALIDGALEACADGVYGVADGATVFSMSSYTLLDGGVTDVQIVFEDDATYAPTLTYQELPAVAVEGKLGAQQNREAAMERGAQARERADERRGGPAKDVPDGGDEDESEDEEDEEVEDDEVEGDEPPSESPAPATSGRR